MASAIRHVANPGNSTGLSPRDHFLYCQMSPGWRWYDAGCQGAGSGIEASVTPLLVSLIEVLGVGKRHSGLTGLLVGLYS